MSASTKPAALADEPVSRPPVAGSVPDLSVLRLATVLLRYRSVIIVATIVGASIMAVLSLLEPRSYTATASFITSSRGGYQTVASAGFLAGFGVGAGDPTQSAAFYANLVEETESLRRVAESSYEVEMDGRDVSTTLVNLRGGKGPSALRRKRAIDLLKSQVNASERLGIVTVSVKWTDPRLAAQIAARVLDALEEFNNRRRRSQAIRDREFVRERLEEAASNLRVAEERQKAFLQANREWASSPSLALEQQRRAREIDMMQALYVDRVQAYERAKIDEIRDAPVLTVLSPPEIPLLPDSRRVVWRTLYGSIFGLLVGIVIALMIALGRHLSRNTSPESRELISMWRATVAGVARPLQGVGRRRRRVPVRT